jgi:hypothetical protein
MHALIWLQQLTFWVSQAIHCGHPAAFAAAVLSVQEPAPPSPPPLDPLPLVLPPPLLLVLPPLLPVLPPLPLPVLEFPPPEPPAPLSS